MISTRRMMDDRSPKLGTMLALLLPPVLLLSAGGCKSSRREVIVMAAASLARAFADLEEQVEQAQPKLDVRLEISGSQEACRKVAELNRLADVVATADYLVIDKILRPGFADYTLRFATNEIVIAHQQHSRYTDQITAENWAEIVQRPKVRLGMVSPDLAPIGYRTLLVWQLAEKQLGANNPSFARLEERLRTHCSKEHTAPHEGELLQLLQTRAIDYAFVYRSTAEEHNLKMVLLPDAYNLGAADQESTYRQARVTVQMKSSEPPKTVTGAPVVYGITSPRRAPNPEGAQLVITYLLGKEGRRILERTGFRPLSPARSDPASALPTALRTLVR